MGTIGAVLTRLAALAVVACSVIGLAACGSTDSQVTVGPPVSGAGAGGGAGGDGPGTTDGGVGDCAQILKTYLSLASTALRGKDAAKSAEKTLEGIRGDLPNALQADLQVVADAFGDIASKGVVRGAPSLATHEFLEANGNILGYLRHDCLPG
jgi:hypothetical protein